MLKNLFKDYINSVRPYQPGKPIRELEQEMGLRHIIKLASNENALGPSGRAMHAMRRAIREVHLYPESGCPYLIERLSRELGVSADQLIVGNGSNEIIELLARGFLSPGDEVLSSESTFLVYPILAQVCGARYVSVPMKDSRYDLAAMADAVSEKTKVVFIANPNNPTGTYVTESELEAFIAKVPKHVIICIDEAYIDFVDSRDFPHVLAHVKTAKPNVLVMRTFSKAYGLAGLRVGYALGCKEIIQYLQKIKQPFNVNSIAQAAATAALDDRFFLWRTKYMVSSGRKYLYREFKRMGLEFLPSQANFVLVNVRKDGEEMFRALLKRGVIVRSMKAYGFDSWIRVTVGRRSHNAHFIRALRRELR